MPTLVVEAVDDGGVDCTNATYATAYSGAGTLSGPNMTNPYLGQDTGFYAEEYFGRFDTSSIPDDATVDSVTAAVGVFADASTTDFTIECRLRDYGATVTTADFVPGANLAALPLLATLTSAGLTVGAYNDMTNVAFPANIVKTGFTPIVLCSAEQTNNSQPTTAEDIRIATSAGVLTMRLTIEYTLAGGGGGAATSVGSGFF